MGFEDGWRWLRNHVKESQSNYYRNNMLRFQNSKVWKNVDTLFTYKTIYENLANGGLPLLQGS